MHDALTISVSRFWKRLSGQAKRPIFGAKYHKCRKYGITIYIEALVSEKGTAHPKKYHGIANEKYILLAVFLFLLL